MNGRLYYLGHTCGWNLARRYVTGTRSDRRDIRAKLSRVRDSYSMFSRGMWDGFTDLVEQRANAILDGIAPRTCNPHKLRRVLERV